MLKTWKKNFFTEDEMMTNDDERVDSPAFPVVAVHEVFSTGMSLRDWFAGQALSNPAFCTGEAPDWQLRAWFGDRRNITKAEILSKQAFVSADAMLKARSE